MNIPARTRHPLLALASVVDFTSALLPYISLALVAQGKSKEAFEVAKTAVEVTPLMVNEVIQGLGALF
jgi:hypothetical protein